MLTKQQFWSLFVAIIMIVSMFYFFTISRETQPNNQNPINNPNQSATEINYIAQSVDAKVMQVFESAMLLGKTKEAETYAVDSLIRSSGLVLSVTNSEFVGDNYRAIIRIKPDSNFEALSDFFATNPSLSGIFIYKQGIISLDGEVELKNEETGLTMEYAFPSNQVNALLNTDTVKGDKIKADIAASFQGSRLTNAIAQETINYETQQMIITTKGSFKVSSLEENYALNANEEFEKRELLESFVSAIEEKIGKEKAKLEIFNIGNDFKAKLKQEYDFNDINSLLSQVEGVASLSQSQETNEIIISTGQDANLLSAKEKILEKLSSEGYEVESFKGPAYSMNGEITNIKEAELDEIKKIAEEKKLKLEVLRKAKIKEESIFAIAEDHNYKVKKGEFEAWISPNIKKDENVELEITMIASKRQGALEIFAKEAKENPGE